MSEVLSLERSELRVAAVLGTVFFLRMLGLFMLVPVLALYARQLPGATPLLIGLAIGSSVDWLTRRLVGRNIGRLVSSSVWLGSCRLWSARRLPGQLGGSGRGSSKGRNGTEGAIWRHTVPPAAEGGCSAGAEGARPLECGAV